MANTEKSIQQLVINRVTTAKYRALQTGNSLHPDQLYVVTDDNWYTQAEIDAKIQGVQAGTPQNVTWDSLQGKPDITEYAKTEDVRKLMDALVDSAPGTLDTLKEIATALNNDPNFNSTMLTQLAKKANTADVNTQLAAKADKTDTNNAIAQKATVTIITWEDES